MIGPYVLSLIDRERVALSGLPTDDELVQAEHRRLVEAVEQVHRSARLLGLDPVQQYAPFSIRADAWLHRTEQESRAWQRWAPRRLELVA